MNFWVWPGNQVLEHSVKIWCGGRKQHKDKNQSCSSMWRPQWVLGTKSDCQSESLQGNPVAYASLSAWEGIRVVAYASLSAWEGIRVVA